MLICHPYIFFDDRFDLLWRGARVLCQFLPDLHRGLQFGGGGVFYSKASIKESYKTSFTKPAGGFTLGVRRQENKKFIRANVVGIIPGDNSCKAVSEVLSTQSCIQ